MRMTKPPGCALCELRGYDPRYCGTEAPEPPCLARAGIIAENPGETELEDGRPLHPLGRSGRDVRDAIASAGMTGKIVLGNVRCCETPADKPGVLARTGAYCLETHTLPAFAGVERLVLLGRKALEAFTGLRDIEATHGAMWSREQVEAIRGATGRAFAPLPPRVQVVTASFHPAFALRGKPPLRPLIRDVIKRGLLMTADRLSTAQAGVRVGCTPAEFHAFMKANAILVMDVETTKDGRIEIVGVSRGGVTLVGRWSTLMMAVFKRWLEDAAHTVIGHNFAFDFTAFAKEGIKVAARVIDTMPGAALVHPIHKTIKKMRTLSLQACTLKYCDGIAPWKPRRVKTTNKHTKKKSYKTDWTIPFALYKVMRPDLAEWQYEEFYCGLDCAHNDTLWETGVKPALHRTGQMALFRDIVTPALPVLTRMTIKGLPLDVGRRDYLRGLARKDKEEASAYVERETKERWTARQARVEAEETSLREAAAAAYDGVAAACDAHPDFRGATRRKKCAGCLGVYEAAGPARAESKRLRAAAAKKRTEGKRLAKGFGADNTNHWRWLLYTPVAQGGLGLVAPGWARTKPSRTHPEGQTKADLRTIEGLLLKYGAENAPLLSQRVLIAHATSRLEGSLAVRPEADGRVRFVYSLHRAARIASGNDEDEDDKRRLSLAGNGQNIRDTDRSIYTASAPGRVLTSIDYSQIEAWITAYLARDVRMLALWRKGWEYRAKGLPVPDEYDVHCLAAALIYGVQPSETRKRMVKFEGRAVSMRYAAKRSRHGKNYGMGHEKAAKMYGLDEDEAKRIWQADDAAWPATTAWRKAVVETMEHDRVLRNSFGRLMRVYGFKWNKWERRWQTTEREEGLAYGPQTDAADIMKAILPGAERIANAHGADLLMTVHDQLLIDGPRDGVQPMLREMVPHMEQDWPQLGRIPGFGLFACPVDVEVGWNWAKKHAAHKPDCDAGCVLNEHGLEEWKEVPHRTLAFEV